VGLPDQDVYRRRSRVRVVSGPRVRVEVVHQTGGRLAEQSGGGAQRVCGGGGDLLRREIRGHTGETVAGRLLRLSAHRRGDDQSERVEGDLGAVAVGVADQPRSQYPVIVTVHYGHLGGVAGTGADQVAGRVPGLCHEQVVPVVGDRGDVAERVAQPAGQE